MPLGSPNAFELEPSAINLAVAENGCCEKLSPFLLFSFLLKVKKGEVHWIILIHFFFENICTEYNFVEHESTRWHHSLALRTRRNITSSSYFTTDVETCIVPEMFY